MNVEFWVTLARAALIMALGVALLVYPDKAFPYFSTAWACSGFSRAWLACVGLSATSENEAFR